MSTAAVARRAAVDRAALDKIQAEILQTSREVEAVHRAPRHVEDIREALLEAVQAATYRYAPDATFGPFLNSNPASPAQLPVNVTFADLVYLFGADHIADLVIERLGLKKAVDGALRASERQQKLAAHRARLDELERAEELEILRLEAAGLQIVRRAQARPELLLAVWASQPAN